MNEGGRRGPIMLGEVTVLIWGERVRDLLGERALLCVCVPDMRIVR